MQLEVQRAAKLVVIGELSSVLLMSYHVDALVISHETNF